MITLQNVIDEVGIAKSYYLKQIASELFIYQSGSSGNAERLNPLKRLIRALSFQITAQVVDDNTIVLYNCLMTLLSGVIGDYIIDPDVVIPGQTVVILQQVFGYGEDKIPFTTTDGNPALNFSNYHSLYYPLYGNNPRLDVLDNQGNFVKDNGTPERITYTDNDPTKDITNILWDFPIGTTGYIQISGKTPNSSGSSSGSGGSGGSGSGSTVLTYDQSSLQNAGTVDEPNWYLPLFLPIGITPFFVTVNGINDGSRYIDMNTNPIKVFGFANNDAQVIKVTVI